MMGLSTTVSTFLLLLFFISSSCFSEESSIKGIDVNNPAIDVAPSVLVGYAPAQLGSRDVQLCERVRISGQSRLKLGSYASALRVTLVPSVVIPEKFHSKIQVSFHKNASLRLCQSEKDEWKSVQKGLWSAIMSPYEDRYIDVKFVGELSGSATVAVEEELQQWRYIFLALGVILLLLAPVVSTWVPFYYSSSMAIGVLLVVIILLFQILNAVSGALVSFWGQTPIEWLGACMEGMKLLPTGRKSFFYLTLYGSVLGAGSFLMHHFSMMVNSVLVNFGLNEEMYNPVSLFVLVGIVLSGAGLGYWLVRKFIISQDGSIDVGIAQFVKWSMRIVAVTFIFQSTIDTPLALAAVGSCMAVYFLINSLKWHGQQKSYSVKKNLWARSGSASAKRNNAEFLSRSMKMSPQGALRTGPRNSFKAWSDSPVKGLVSPSNSKGAVVNQQDDYYSTFHKTPNKKKFSRKEWQDFTEESTRQAVSEWASSPEFTDWIINHADRIKLLPEESSEEEMGSGSDSTDENGRESESGVGLFKWRARN